MTYTKPNWIVSFKYEADTRIGVRVIKEANIDELVHLLVKEQPQLAQELSDKIAFKIQDNDLTQGENNASKI